MKACTWAVLPGCDAGRNEEGVIDRGVEFDSNCTSHCEIRVEMSGAVEGGMIEQSSLVMRSWIFGLASMEC